MSRTTLHPDWPEFPESALTDSWYGLPEPIGDFGYALEQASMGVGLTDVATVTRYYVAYHGSEWRPGDQGGSELDMVVMGKLHDGRWFSLEAWNDYTGWGCRDGSDGYMGNTEDDVVLNGLTNSGRVRIGYKELTA